MASLIIALPLSPTRAGEYAYAVSPDGAALTDHGSAPATALPPSTELVAVVPARLLSWHQVNLPKVPGHRLQEALAGVLEEQLLDDPQTLHLALEPAYKSKMGSDNPIWVAACDKTWLRQALEALEAAGRPVTRVVPEMAPGPAQWWIHGSPGAAWCAQASSHGVAVLPLSPALGRPAGELYAEPAVAAAAEQALGLKVALRSGAQQAVLAAQSGWNLAQFEMASAGRKGAGQKLLQGWQQLSQGAEWRAVRWGLACLLLIQFVALNAWSWRERQALDAKREQIRNMFVQAFPRVSTVIDPVRQMAQQVSARQQASGQVSATDLEVMLTYAQAVFPPARLPSGIEFSPGEVRFSGLELSPAESATAQAKLKPEGYDLSTRGTQWVLRRQGASGGRS